MYLDTPSGSPPRVRENSTSTLPCSRITPRMRGKPLNRYKNLLPRRIPPPRMRGKRKSTLATRFAVRITPAHAGKTPRVCVSAPRRADHPRACGKTSTHFSGEPSSADHPRACGENEKVCSAVFTQYESPPRVRGKEAPPPSASHP